MLFASQVNAKYRNKNLEIQNFFKYFFVNINGHYRGKKKFNTLDNTKKRLYM